MLLDWLIGCTIDSRPTHIPNSTVGNSLPIPTENSVNNHTPRYFDVEELVERIVAFCGA
jgi:hypothetical protein